MTSPAGPGRFATRTDRQPMSVPTGMPYGDATDMHQAEQAAPMAATPQAADIPAAAVAAPQQSAPPPTPFGAPTERPHEPVTHGADLGPGADSSILSTPIGAPAGGAVSQAIAKAAAADSSGVLQQLLQAAQQRGI